MRYPSSCQKLTVTIIAIGKIKNIARTSACGPTSRNGVKRRSPARRRVAATGGARSRARVSAAAALGNSRGGALIPLAHQIRLLRHYRIPALHVTHARLERPAIAHRALGLQLDTKRINHVLRCRLT